MLVPYFIFDFNGRGMRATAVYCIANKVIH